MSRFDPRPTLGFLARGARPLIERPDWFARITPRTLGQDAIAGLTGASIVLPQGVAFAAIAGLPPEYGFYTAMVTPVVAAVFGSSWHAVSGPTTAISALVFGALSGSFTPGSPEFISAAISLAVLVGLIQVMLGLVRLGGLVDFVSHSVMVGFMAVAALLIALSQMRHALAVELPRPEHLTEFLAALPEALRGTDPASLFLAALALAVAILFRRIFPKGPNYLVALAAATLAYLAMGEAAQTVHTVGTVPSVLPGLAMPQMNLAVFDSLASASVAIALVGLLEAMSVARGIATQSGQPIDNNREFLGQGMSNLAGGFFQCYPGSASFTRSGVNYEAGAQTPLSAIFAAVFLLVILLFVAPWFALVPTPAMAGIIILVAWKLIKFEEITHIVRSSRSETWIAIVTFVTGLLVDLEFSIYAGVLLSLLLFLNWTAHPTLGIAAPDPKAPRRVFRNVELNNLPECPQLVIVRLHGPLYFGSVEYVRRWFRVLETQRPAQRHVLFIAAGSSEFDLPAAEFLIDLARRLRQRGGALHVQVKTPRSLALMRDFGAMAPDAVGKAQFHLSKGDAVETIVPQLDPAICDTCPARIFRECPQAR
ncbi:SulP family inorganic anion transporter [Mameliella sediminis]|uniref:SulP family inorganic anion transporter n=1 Tax=Mameliella sediminis TaxID=2836866 RepID=UPI001C47F5AD|nr:SulP family inorganic anion transporter [Mameliella sediminis]MBV7393464.1 SulP family inorganic anion transporter [Mameliella sediminis]MBY6161137.1 SulP family inorganic anion transporter [Mameliella alba]MBY6169607.1 SulP family inorganic anion transporter [Mameliella alba]MBY6174626.1 SulP family inorganic anion transporter [Mameliella alba]